MNRQTNCVKERFPKKNTTIGVIIIPIDRKEIVWQNRKTKNGKCM